MTSTPMDVARLADLVDEMQRRITKLEKQLAEAQGPQGPVPIDTILAISAAVAAYLGVRAHIRQVRLIQSTTWGQIGRLNVHASHQRRH